MHLVKQKYKLEQKRNGIENGKSQTVLTKLLPQPIEETQIKSKTVMKWSSQKKKRAFFVPFISSKDNFLKTCFSTQCIMYWVHFQNIYIFTYQRILLHTPLLLVSKVDESLQKPSQPAWDVFEMSQTDLHWERHLKDLSETSQKRCLFCDVFKMSQIHLKKDVFFETSLRRLKYISKKMSFLWRL